MAAGVSGEATFFIGSIFDRIARVHHLCRNRLAHPGYWYVQNR